MDVLHCRGLGAGRGKRYHPHTEQYLYLFPSAQSEQRRKTNLAETGCIFRENSRWPRTMKSCGEIPFYGDPPAYRPGNGRPLRVVPTHITYCTISFRRGYPSGETVARSPRGLFPQGSPKENPLLLPRGQKNRPAVKVIAGLLFSICNVSEQVRMGTSAKKKQFQYNDVKLHCPHLS